MIRMLAVVDCRFKPRSGKVCAVMISMLAVVDRRFKPRSGIAVL